MPKTACRSLNPSFHTLRMKMGFNKEETGFHLANQGRLFLLSLILKLAKVNTPANEKKKNQGSLDMAA